VACHAGGRATSVLAVGLAPLIVTGCGTTEPNSQPSAPTATADALAAARRGPGSRATPTLTMSSTGPRASALRPAESEPASAQGPASAVRRD
jgi:hypothetical protein